MHRREVVEFARSLVGFLLAIAAVVGIVVAATHWWKGYYREREERVLRCFGETKVWQCKVATRPWDCMAYLEARAAEECSDDREEGRQ